MPTKSGKTFEVKYKFEKKFIKKLLPSELKSQMTVETTATDEPVIDYEARYKAYLEEYENELADLELKDSLIAKDVVTASDELRYIKEHFEDEEMLESSLGNKYMNKGKEGRGRGNGAPTTKEPSLDQSIMGDFMS